MNKYLPVAVTVVATIAAAIFTPAFISAHPGLFAGLNAAAQLLHAALPSVFSQTTPTPAS
jgi:hypothetical protein